MSAIKEPFCRILWIGAVCGVFGLVPMAIAQDQSAQTSWRYPDPLVSTTPTNFSSDDPRDARPERSPTAYFELAKLLRETYAKPVDQWPQPNLDPEADFTPMGPARPPVFPADNPHNDAKEDLGELLFFDGRLSGVGQMSCASCHVAELGWGDGRARSLGHSARQLTRNTPSILNSGFLEKLFHDGRVDSMEALVLEVFANPDEMRIDREQLAERVAKIPGYRAHFKEAFGDETVTAERIAAAIATHVRTVVSDRSSDFERFLRGDHDRLSDAAVRGLHLFRTDARCINCHNGPEFTDGQFHNIGLSYYGRRHEDLGRYEVTGKPDDVGRFKTPGLRNITRTAPYMHNGFFDLEGVVDFYNSGGFNPEARGKYVDDPLWPTTSDLLIPLHLNDQDKADLLAFLEALTERARRDMLPELPPDEVVESAE